ncbi:uncharacterized protein LOC127433932 [Myxocyprinus asiaticus]|uniref:uncharacterized protein LOC127433932 n=1 Tax=Myxocyprinus asiaticus TaxID=70543 RepID=UPI00222383E5|nr:uncharacterized protein LOC127433932 [Myxocyprinus asiaticus]
MYCQQNQADWSRFLPWAEYVQNSILKPSTKLTPFQCVLGFQPPLFPWSGELSDVPAVNDWFQRSEAVWDQAHVHVQRAINRGKEQADRHRHPCPNYVPGQWVWLSTRDLRLHLPCKKLSPRVELEGGDAGPSPMIMDGEEAFLVRDLLDSRRLESQIQYLVDWEGYGPEERSWVKADDILDPNLITEFHRTHPEKPAPRPRGRPRRQMCSRVRSRSQGGGGALSQTPVNIPQSTTGGLTHRNINIELHFPNAHMPGLITLHLPHITQTI